MLNGVEFGNTNGSDTPDGIDWAKVAEAINNGLPNVIQTDFSKLGESFKIIKNG